MNSEFLKLIPALGGGALLVVALFIVAKYKGKVSIDFGNDKKKD